MVKYPETLYHGSMYKQNELMPGFKRTGELQMWDGVESNQYLYASTDLIETCNLGIGSAAEKTFDSDRFVSVDNNIWIYARNPIDLNKFLAMQVYIYTIPFRIEDKWIKNNNPFNKIDTEWITKNTIHNVSVKELDIKEFLKGKFLTFTQAPTTVDPLNVIREYREKTKRHVF